MNKSWNIRTLLVILIFFLIAAGCAKRQDIKAEEIRQRAARSFDDLKTEETGQVKSFFPNKGKKTDAGKQVKPEHLIETGKAAPGERPAWVDGDSAEYPSSFYLTGVGCGADLQTARNRARAEIARIFYSNIESRTRTYQKYLKTSSGNKSNTKESFDIGDITRVSTQKVLSGVRIAQIYHETGKKPCFYALAILDRSRSEEILVSKINKYDQEIQGLVINAQQENDKLVKIKHLKGAADKYMLREACNAELQIVSTSGKVIPSKANFSEIQNELSAILMKDFLIAVKVAGNRADDVKEALVEGLNREGFSVCDNPFRASVIVDVDVKIQPIERGTPRWKNVKWKVFARLIDHVTGAGFGSVSKKGREGHLSLQQAEDRAVQAIRKSLTTDITKDITDYIFTRNNN